MENYSQQRAGASKWIYDRRGRVKWWRWSVLTAHNPDPESLKVPPETAFLIFGDMVQQGLFLPVIADDGGDAFTINPGKEDEWLRVMNPTWHSVRQSSSKIIEMVISGIVGAVLGVIATLVAQSIFGIG